MKIILVDDEELALVTLEEVVHEVQPEAEIATFLNATDALSYLAVNTVDIALLDIEMDELSGLALAERCKEFCSAVNVIFVTGYSQYTLDAFKLHASGYLMKPVRAEDLRAELKNLRHPLPAVEKRVRIQTFGNFEVFVDDRALCVARKKCKECLAYLVDRRGAGVPYSQLSSVLWEDQPIDRSVQKKTQKVISDLVKALAEVDAQNILIRTRVDIAVNTKMVDCDYYQAIAGNMAWMNSFTGEYMSNYSWAEFTLGELVEIKKRNIMP